MTLEFTYKGLQLTVTGRYVEEDYENRDTPGTSERFIIDSVKEGEEDVELNLDSLENYILETQL